MADVTSDGFPPIAAHDARILVLGSLPGQRSIAARQYYAHPQNAFWPIMERLFAIRGSYEQRCAQLVEHRIALWDVLASSVRPGSMDSDIRVDSATVNDFATFLIEHPHLKRIAFNGKKAESLFHRFVNIDALDCEVALVGLPSTSPAYAAMSFSGKLAAWREAFDLDKDRRGT